MAATRRRGAGGRRAVRPEDLVRMVGVGDPRISPDGTRVVYVREHVEEPNRKVRDLWMVDAAGGAPARFTAGGKDGQPRWSPDGTRIAFVSERDGGIAQVFLIDAGGGEARPLTRLPEGSIQRLQWSPDGRRLAIAFRECAPDRTQAATRERKAKGLSKPARVLDDWFYRFDGDGYFDGQRHVLMVIDAEDGTARTLWSKDRLGTFSFSFHPDGRRVVVATNRHRKALVQPWKAELVAIDVESGAAERLADLPDGTREAVAWSPDGRQVAYAGVEGRDRIWGEMNTTAWSVDVRGGRHRALIEDDVCLVSTPISDTAEARFEATLQWSPDGERLLTTIGRHGECHLAAIPRAGGRARFLTRGPLVVSLGSVSDDGRLAAVTVARWDRPPEVALARLGARSATLKALTDHNGWMSELELSRPSGHWVRSPDGTRVQAWVLRPAGDRSARARRRPAVLEVHGGPHGQYGVGYFHEFQVLAAQGLVVVYSNPRGSKGYGEAHCAAIRGAWGDRDWQDVLAVAEWMARRPYVQPRRLGIMGGSYGGYITNWAIGHTDMFAGAITDRCVSNLVSMMGSSDIMEPPDGYWPGNAWDRPEALWDQSPLKHLGNARTPTLIIHSEGDLRCNIEQGEQVFAALKHNDVPARFVRYPRSTSHGMSRAGPPDLRVHRLQQIVSWWDRWLKRPKSRR